MNYKSKYLKYKLKYLITQKLLGGSNSDRPKSAPTTLYENKEARKVKVINYDEGIEPGHPGDKKDRKHQRLADELRHPRIIPPRPKPAKLDLDLGMPKLDLGISELDLGK